MWHYQLIRRKLTYPAPHEETGCLPEHFYGIYEYYTDLNMHTSDPIEIIGDSIEEVQEMLDHIAEDIARHGVMEYQEEVAESTPRSTIH